MITYRTPVVLAGSVLVSAHIILAGRHHHCHVNTWSAYHAHQGLVFPRHLRVPVAG